MRYIAAEDVAKAKEMDLLTYLRNYEPQDLVHVSGNTYCTREHDSLRISNGKWCWFSQGIGGRSALDYLIKVKGIPFTQAVEIILGREAEKPPVFYRQKERKHTELLMPELSETTEVDFDPDMTEPLKEKKIKVVLCEPGKVARVAEIRTELSDLQKVVGGLIEPYYPFEEQVCIVCNDEGKYNGMRPCRAIYGEDREISKILLCFHKRGI